MLTEPWAVGSGQWAGRQARPSTAASRVVHVLSLAMVVLAVAGNTFAQGAIAEMYRNALAHERELRAPARNSAPTLNELRAAIDAYEAIVRRHPRSGYSDNALWQGAGLALEAFDRFRDKRDLQTGLRLLRALPREYPTSSLAPRVGERIQQFQSLSTPVLIRGIERARLPEVVRITVQLDGEVRYHQERLDNPARLFFDLYGTVSTPQVSDAHLTFNDDDDIVREIRLGRHPNDITRVVLDLEGVASYSVFTLYNPYRLVIDCKRPAERTAQSDETSRPPIQAPPTVPLDVPAPTIPSANSTGTFSLARQLGLGISRVVIDPGHGGHDPGAQDDGLTEAVLVLDIALRLEERLLMQPQIEVVLTRRTDIFVPLEERTAIANREDADLFLSIHTNASRNRSTHGVETYLLNFASDPEAEAVAARENSASGGSMHSLPSIVRAIALNNKLDESRDLAEIVQRAMVERLGPANPQLRDIGIKQAPFVVLIGARMPSVLTEIAFITHHAEAQLLKSDNYRRLIADALFDAIVRYQRSLKNTQATVKQERSGES